MSIEFLLIIDLYKPKLFPKLYCISSYLYHHFVDGRDIFKELPSSKNPKRTFIFSNLLSEILEFIQTNFKKEGYAFFGSIITVGDMTSECWKKDAIIKKFSPLKKVLY